MPTPSSIAIPDFNGTSRESGTFQDASGKHFPAIRFDDNAIADVKTGLTGTYTDNDIIGTAFTFANAAANVGWGGSISSASLHIDDTTVINDTFSLLLFSLSPTVTNDTQLSALSLTEAIADSYIGTIVFANSHQLNGRSLFRASSINQRFTCDAASSSLFGILVINAAASRSLSSKRVGITLQVTRS